MTDKKPDYSKEFLKYQEAGRIVMAMSKEQIENIREEIKALRKNEQSKTNLKAYFDIKDDFLLLFSTREYCDAVFGPGSYRNMSNGRSGELWAAAAIITGNLEKLVGVQVLPQLLQEQKQNKEQPSETASS